jgi:hypothetical protein
MSVASMLGFRRRSNWQHRRREDLQKNPRGEEEKEHFMPRWVERPIPNLRKKECLRVVNEWLSGGLKLGCGRTIDEIVLHGIAAKVEPYDGCQEIASTIT